MWRFLRIGVFLLLLVAFTVLQVVALRFVDPPISAVMIERRLHAWADREKDYQWSYAWRDMDQIAACLPLAVVAAEDQKFAEHSGFDFEAIEKAFDHNVKGGRVRGGSTISQQVAKNLFLWQGRSWLRKGLEAWYTILIELFWPKSRILEVYVNIAEFGDGIYGAQGAASRFWEKDAARLTISECTRLAAVLPAPRSYDARSPGPYVQRRAAWIQRQMRQIGGPDYLEQMK
ncbi:MAG: monofunctional biosynthetic peptidoglycan transglycosylase [Xanthomonadaceae bacterium]|nr:monofunctional biosynthetic peptidoglycan transglycosylase [Xanthomonadaceae bacterium]